MTDDKKEVVADDATLQDDIAAAWDETAKAEPEVKAETKEPEAKTETEDRDDGRDDKGRFKPKEAKPEDGEDKAPAVEAAKTATAPEHWSQLDKDKFASLPEELKPLYLESRKSIEAGYDSKFKEIAAVKPLIQEIDQIFQPFDGVLQRAGQTRGQIIRNLVNTWAALNRDPKGTLSTLARQYGVNLGGPSQTEAAPEIFDPVVAEWKTATDRKLGQIESVVQQFGQAQQMAYQASLQSHVEAFRNAKNPDGSLAHPYFDEVKEAAAGLLRGGNAKTLEEAYAQATSFHPEVSKALAEKARVRDATEREAKRKAEAEKAKKAAGVRVESRATQAVQARKPGRIDEDINAAWDSLEGRA